jgi:hypothetical protein
VRRFSEMCSTFSSGSALKAAPEKVVTAQQKGRNGDSGSPSETTVLARTGRTATG